MRDSRSAHDPRNAYRENAGQARNGAQQRYAYPQQRPVATRSYQDVSRYSDTSRYGSGYGAGSTSSHAGSNKGLIVGIVIGIIAIAALIWIFIIPKPFGVTVNGKQVTMNPGATVASLVDEGHARPIPGNLVAVDGSLIATGEGERFSAMIDGQPAATDAKLSGDMVVTIDNGGDKMEDYTSTEQVIPFDTVNDDTSFEAYWFGSIHQLQDGKDGIATVKTGAISGKTATEVTQPAISGGYHNFTVQTSEPVIALTFDDGPWPGTTHEILDILEANGAKATFFTIGEQIGEHSDAVQRANDMGCEICTHTWDHASGSGQGVDLTLMSAQEQIDEVTQGFAAIADAIGHEPAHIMRAPGGNFHGDIIETLWPYVDAEIGWDVDTEDWSLPGAEAIAARILSVEPGQVILMHDGGGDREQTVAALRTALPELVRRGYKCVTVSELLAYGNTSQQQPSAAQEPAVEAVEMEEG